MALVNGIPHSVLRVRELAQIKNRLNKEIIAVEGRTLKGLIMAAAFIRNKTEHTIPLTPVDLGNLRSSWFVVTAKGVPAGQRSAEAFKGPKASEIASDHMSTIIEAQGIVAANEATKGKFIMLGYSANYAMWVHENMGAKNWSRIGSGPKWFQGAIYRNKAKIVQIVKDNAEIKG